MSRTETANSLTTSSVTGRIDSWSDRMERLSKMQVDLSSQLESFQRMQSASTEDLAARLTPIAEAMASLIEQTRQTMERVVTQAAAGHKQAVAAVEGSTKAAQSAASEIRSAMLRVEDQVRKLEEAAKDARENPPTSPWGPAIISALLPLGAVLWLAWKMGVLTL